MPRTAIPYTQAKITRALKGVVAAGVSVARIEIDRDGRIIVIAGKPADEARAGGADNEWDQVA